MKEAFTLYTILAQYPSLTPAVLAELNSKKSAGPTIDSKLILPSVGYLNVQPSIKRMEVVTPNTYFMTNFSLDLDFFDLVMSKKETVMDTREFNRIAIYSYKVTSGRFIVKGYFDKS